MIELSGRTQAGCYKVSLAVLRQLAKGMAHCRCMPARLLVETNLVALGQGKTKCIFNLTKPFFVYFDWYMGNMQEKEAKVASSIPCLIVKACSSISWHLDSVYPL